MAASEPSATAKVILGALSLGPHSGYEIKALVDGATDFFWSASYAGIYPELRRLEAAGLIAGTEEPTGERPRRTFELTAAGREQLDAWLEAEPSAPELRDEPLLQAFFAPDTDSAARAYERKARAHADLADRLREIEPMAASSESGMPLTTLRFGLACHEFCRDWCEREAIRLRSGEEADR